MTLTIRRSECANLLEPISGLTLNIDGGRNDT